MPDFLKHSSVFRDASKTDRFFGATAANSAAKRHCRGQKSENVWFFLTLGYAIPRRRVATYFPETNVLVPLDSVAETSNTPTSKYVIIRVTPCVEQHDGPGETLRRS